LKIETQEVTGNAEKIIRYNYDLDGLKSRLTFSDGTYVNYFYTARNQLKSITASKKAIATYAYDRSGNRISRTLENNTITLYNYDNANRLIALEHKKNANSLARFDYGYNQLNRKIYEKRDSAKGDVFSYDATNQIINVKYNSSAPDSIAIDPARTVNYYWDAVGNRKVVDDGAVQTVYKTNSLNQYLSAGGDSLTYNINGHIASYRGWAYSYDAQGRLIKVSKSNITIQFAYDPADRCVKRTINQASSYLYYDDWSLIEETNGNDQLLYKYINSDEIDEIVARVKLTEVIYYHQDALGNIVRLTNQLGNVIEQYTYDVFGKATIKNANSSIISTSQFANRFMFTGREIIKEADLYDFRNRVYSPSLGRFLQTDPIGFLSGDYNLYRYVLNDPVNLTDPAGNKGWWKKTIQKLIKDAVTSKAKDMFRDCPNKHDCREPCLSCCDKVMAGATILLLGVKAREAFLCAALGLETGPAAPLTELACMAYITYSTIKTFKELGAAQDQCNAACKDKKSVEPPDCCGQKK
jgi:RHS repeat-associated protein